MNGEPIVLGESWGVALQREVADATFKESGRMATAALAALEVTGPDVASELMKRIAEDDAFTAAIEQAETADAKPPAQTIEAGGFDTAQVVEAVASGQYQWDHPAAAHMALIYKHEPFQRFAMYRLHADAFAAPMECATRLITRAVKDKPMDAAVAALTAKMDEYMAWAASNNLQLWPVN